MALIIPDIGEQHLLKLIIGNIRPTKLILNLYSNEVDLSGKDFLNPDFLLGNQISDGSFVSNGYSSVELEGSNWTVSTDVTGTTVASYNSNVTFSFSNGSVDKIYGYFISASSNPAFGYTNPYFLDLPASPLWAERFDNGPYTILPSGSTINLIPKIKLGSSTYLYPTPTPTPTPTLS